MIGYFGTIKFTVSNKKAQSFNNLRRSVSSNWKEHDIYKRKPFSEYLGPGQGSISFRMELEASLGVNPYELMEKWNSIIEKGKHDILVIGDNQIGKFQWKVTGADEEWKYVFKDGVLLSASINITMTEYCNVGVGLLGSFKSSKKASKTKTKKESKKTTSSSYVIGGTYKVYCTLTGYYTSDEAKNLHAINKTGKVKKGTYYVFNSKYSMINVTSVKGVPGSWINPTLNKRG